MSIVALLFSIAAMILAVISYRTSTKLKRLENFLQYGTAEAIELQIEHERQDLQEHVEKIKKKYRTIKLDAATELAKRNISGDKEKQMMDKIGHEEQTKIERLNKISERRIALLTLKKSQLESIL